MPLSEADTRSKLIDPALYACGWTEAHIRREETQGAVEIVDGKPRRRTRGRTDYTLRLRINADSQPVAVAVVEAKADHLPAIHGLDQAKMYSDGKRLNVPFSFSSNGHQFVEFDRFTGLTHSQRPMADFPSPDALRQRYEQGMGFALTDPAAKPLLARYAGGEGGRRYYQDAAIRAVLERIAQCGSTGEPPRALLSLATGAGKTFIAVQLLRRIADAGQLRRALFVCDRDELRKQATSHFRAAFGADAQAVSGGDAQKNAKVLIATYQTLDIESDDSDANFLVDNYPIDHFSHIVIDECHRSAWGRWSEVLRRNPNAVQVGLTATPRRLTSVTGTEVSHDEDVRLSADNLKYFGEPVYEYDMAQGIEDGYLAACEIVRRDIFEDGAREQDGGLTRADLDGKQMVDAVTGELLTLADARASYEPGHYEAKLILPERVAAMCADLFAELVATGTPEQKTIVFCARDNHADAVAMTMNNLYASWCASNGRKRLDPYAFKCTASVQGGDLVADLRASNRSHFIATTVDLLTTGVDVPAVANIVFFKYVRSPIAFYQMVGRGTRINLPTGKLMFRVYDYTNATRLFGEEFITTIGAVRSEPSESPDPTTQDRTIEVQGFDVRVTPAGKFILTQGADGRATPVTVEDYRDRLASRLVGEAATLDQFRDLWVNPPNREAMMQHLPDAGRSALLLQDLAGMKDYDLYDVLAEIGYGVAPHTREVRADSFGYKNSAWLAALPLPAAATVTALTRQFARSGTDALESSSVFNTPEVRTAGGIAALRQAGEPRDLLTETRRRVFAA